MTRPQRYDRQIRFAPIGENGQQSLSHACVAILGCGALGSVAAELLARAGIGRLRIIDRDVVEWSNLQRQALFDEADANKAVSKAEAAHRHLSAVNSSIEIQPVVSDVTAENIDRHLSGADLVIDASDNFALRFLLNDWSLSTSTAWVHGGCVGATGQVRLFEGQGGPCFRCLVPEPPPASAVETCDTAGVVGSATHLIASLQVTEAIKWLSGNREAVRRTLLSIDLWNNRIREITIAKGLSANCVACEKRDLQFLNGNRGHSAEVVLCGRDAVQISRLTNEPIDLHKVAGRWESIGRVQETPFFVRLFPGDERSITLFRDGRVIVTGTSEVAEARVLYDRFVGG